MVATKPIIHLNGSGVENLLGPLKEAVSALSAAADAVAKTAPHPRDYYVSPNPGLYDKARTEHISRLRKIEEIREELTELAVDLIGQQRD